MFEHIDLENYYSFSSPSSGGTIEASFKLPGYENFLVKNYYLNKEINNGPVEWFTVYENGLVVFFRQTANNLEIYSNKEFRLEDDGTFYLVS